jgi:DNA-binding CsgD family transcriptional regulator
MTRPREFAIGERYEQLTVIGERHGSPPHILVRCDCGTEKDIATKKLGRVMSCGCFHKVSASQRATKHGRTGTPEYITWASMKVRCYKPSNKNYVNYGGRGITVCPEWLDDFEAFLAYMGPRPSPKHSIDRIDNDGNYEPGNVRWADRYVQSRNRRPQLRETCIHGHDRTPANVQLDKLGRRVCIPCSKEQHHRNYLRRRQLATPRVGLPPRMAEALELAADGLRPVRIAQQLGVKHATVTAHLTRAQDRLGAATRAEAIEIARERGFISAA